MAEFMAECAYAINSRSLMIKLIKNTKLIAIDIICYLIIVCAFFIDQVTTTRPHCIGVIIIVFIIIGISRINDKYSIAKSAYIIGCCISSFKSRIILKIASIDS